ncbi:uncharacterized protein BKCO1_930005 [Diplodia corticola]|uniref:Uncharacterized protein n=1 Tax=Diplodia corticola TaxID=236234 RepID=A0A1J9QM25_9PEZI|nr:uncharacterized protein BKCO1_930005 [Diplodia corticola]OJD29106.1 hypothetical protein BKCO1_930005 [Diplodia corticola]
MSDADSVSASTSKSTSQSKMKSTLFSPNGSGTKTDDKPKPASKPTWMDASLSDKERWKKWEKERDKQFYGRGGTAGYYSTFYKTSKAWWIGIFGSWGT